MFIDWKAGRPENRRDMCTSGREALSMKNDYRWYAQKLLLFPGTGSKKRGNRVCASYQYPISSSIVTASLCTQLQCIPVSNKNSGSACTATRRTSSHSSYDNCCAVQRLNARKTQGTAHIPLRIFTGAHTAAMSFSLRPSGNKKRRYIHTAVGTITIILP